MSYIHTSLAFSSGSEMFKQLTFDIFD